MDAAELTTQIDQATSLLGLLLVLITLFTSEQARRLADERRRSGGAHPNTLHQVFGLSIALATVTILSIGSLAPLVFDVFGAINTADFRPVLAIFVLAWSLLLALAAWQISLAVASRK